MYNLYEYYVIFCSIMSYFVVFCIKISYDFLICIQVHPQNQKPLLEINLLKETGHAPFLYNRAYDFYCFYLTQNLLNFIQPYIAKASWQFEQFRVTLSIPIINRALVRGYSLFQYNIITSHLNNKSTPFEPIAPAPKCCCLISLYDVAKY